MQQSLRRGVDLRNRGVGVSSVGRGIKDPDRLSRFGSGSVGGLGKVPLPLQQRWYCRKLVERIFRAPAVVVDEIKSLAPAMIDMWNVQRPAHRTAETILQVLWLFRRLAGE